MPEPRDSFVYALESPLGPGGLAALRRAVSGALDGGATSVVLDVDSVAVLGPEVISTLLDLRRTASGRGASLSLRAGRQRILDTLRVTALSKIFSVYAPTVAPQPVRPASRKRRRLVAAFALGLLAFGSLGGRGIVAAPESPAELVRNVVAQNAEMESYEAQVSVDFRLRSFPYASQHLDGTTYFKRPDNFEVVFDKVPSYAKGFEKLYSDIDDPTSWERRFDMSLVGARNVDGHSDLVVRLVQKVRGMIDHEDVAIDPSAWRIDEMEWHYYNGGTIAMSQQYQSVGRFTVLARQHATIRIPFVHAAADATYTDYRTNVAIDASVFTREKR